MQFYWHKFASFFRHQNYRFVCRSGPDLAWERANIETVYVRYDPSYLSY